MLAGRESLLVEEEESVAMAVGEDEEGAITDTSLDVVLENSKKMKVRRKLGRVH